MIGRILISKDEYELYKYTISEDFRKEYNYTIFINANLNESYKSLISQNQELEHSIDQNINYLLDQEDNNKDELNFLNHCKQNIHKLLKDAEYIEIDFTLENIIKYLKNNPELKNKKIILSEYNGLKINEETLEILNKEFKDNIDNFYFNLYNNTNLVNFNECKKTINHIDNIVKKIESYNFSPLEKIMYVYDIVRNKIYADVNESEDLSISRDLTSSLLGNKIVCLGYSKIFQTILEKLGINSRICYLSSKTSTTGHARNEIYIRDKKYEIDGVYYFDTTWDRKIEENDNSYLSKYKYFAKTYNEIYRKEYFDPQFPYFSENIMWEFEEIMETEGFKGLTKDMIKSINYMSKQIKDEKLINPLVNIPFAPMYGKIDKERIINELINLVEYYNKPLSTKTLLEVLYNVRKQQYYDNSGIYELSVDEFSKIIINSGWIYQDISLLYMLHSIFINNYDETTKHLVKKSLEIIKDNELDKKIECIRLTKTLRNIYNQKINNF